MHVYFVSFTFENADGRASGMCEIVSPVPYTRFADIEGCCAAIRAANPGAESVTILNYQLLRIDTDIAAQEG